MKYILLLSSIISLTACQVISPIFVNYNGVRRDVAQWINQQTLLSMQQKRSLVQLSKAQQQLYRFSEYDAAKRLAVSQQNQIALYCAQQHVSQKKIMQLQQRLYDEETPMIIENFERLAPQIRLDPSQIQCE
ncbi:hypothetical protein GFH30_03820 [Acinetobacter wanghuae]|uniref:Lipoprotein n=1 Tax=Acinetobacter wanghuae TaxID=2662362 RepID=A0A5Q0P4A7_9GAMM|nr:hypothetical protein [Acinetobacter wanghuae]MQW92724.1 hypothetical protein [Acinetobacter wanghuae]QGA10578.1 hypothetical protein GFH30_03820 [Acinetobacter wanghuae]